MKPKFKIGDRVYFKTEGYLPRLVKHIIIDNTPNEFGLVNEDPTYGIVEQGVEHHTHLCLEHELFTYEEAVDELLSEITKATNALTDLNIIESLYIKESKNE